VHIQTAPLHNLVCDRGSLRGTIRVQLDPIPLRWRVRCNGSKSRAIADARIDCGARHRGELQEFSDTLGLGYRQWVKSEALATRGSHKGVSILFFQK
jgi:hypothetical protein